MARKLCRICNIRVQYTGGGDDKAPIASDMCNPCYTEGGWENTHSDENHDENNLYPGCWICHPELNLALAAPVKGHTNTAAKTHTSHAGCKHLTTPVARATCRATHTWNGTAWV